ncbi:diguanylate cyclase [Candidatus Desantisbacteria bacterium]|nr:diguanylate cyclase [Candidatus Desantisbacteria bacterium]
MDDKTFNPSNYKVMIIDEDEKFSNVSKTALEKEGYNAVICTKKEEAIETVNKLKIHIVLMNHSFPEKEELIPIIRKRDKNIQIILLTQNKKEIPVWDIMQQLNIQGYFYKFEGLDKILIWVNMSAKIYHHLTLLEKSKEGLRYILKITPLIYKMQPLQDLLKGTLLQLISLMEGENGFISTIDLRATIAQTKLNFFEYQLGVGSFANKNCLNILNDLQKKLINIVVPIILRDKILGIIYIESSKNFHEDIELLLIFSNQIAIAIENTILYEMATIDSLTKLYVKGFFNQQLREELKSSYRYNYPLLVLFIDIDEFKNVNDSFGHQFGDYVLTEVAQIIKNSTRETDVACRYGGDEFSIILPHTNQQGGNILAGRIKNRVHKKEFISPTGENIHTSISIGISSLNFIKPHDPRTILPGDFFDNISHDFIEAADKALYLAKNSGRNKVCEGEPIFI